MPLHTFSKLIGASTELRKLAAGARRVQELQTLFVESAPRELAAASRVKSLRAGTLTVAADNAAVAAKLKQLVPRVLNSIRKNESEVTAIRIEVQVSGTPGRRPQAVEKTSLSDGAVEEFERLAHKVAPGELRSALTRLVRHHRRRNAK
jgi:hypothetical protein